MPQENTPGIYYIETYDDVYKLRIPDGHVIRTDPADGKTKVMAVVVEDEAGSTQFAVSNVLKVRREAMVIEVLDFGDTQNPVIDEGQWTELSNNRPSSYDTTLNLQERIYSRRRRNEQNNQGGQPTPATPFAEQ